MSKRRAAARSGIWSFILQWSRFGLNTVVFLFLARWLSLEEIGAFAVAFAPINLVQLVQRAGFSETVVQGRAEPGEETDTIFWMSVGFGTAMSLCLFGLSFVIAPIMNAEGSGAYLAAMSLIPAVIGIAAVPEGLLRRRLEIRTLALRTTASLTVAGGIALWFGYAGYGGWALTAFAAVNAVLSSILVLALVNWRPGGGPRRAEARRVLPVLLSISGRGIAANSTMPLLQLMVGAALGPAAAGAFQIAQRFLSLSETVTLTPLRFMALSVFVQVRDDARRLQRVVSETAGLVSLVSAPIYFGLLAVAPVLLPLAVGTENGTASIRPLQAFLLLGSNVGLYAVFAQTLTAIGRPNVALRWSIVLFVLNVTSGAFAVLHSATLTALTYSLLGYLLAPFVLGSLAAHAGIAPRGLARVVYAPAAAGAVMAGAVLLLGQLLSGRFDNLILLALQIGLGVVIYAGLSLLISRRQVVTTLGLLATLRTRRGAA